MGWTDRKFVVVGTLVGTVLIEGAVKLTTITKMLGSFGELIRNLAMETAINTKQMIVKKMSPAFVSTKEEWVREELH